MENFSTYTPKQQKVKAPNYLIVFLIIVLVSAGIAVAGYLFKSKQLGNLNPIAGIGGDQPKYAENYLNGEKVENGDFSQRPLGVMINNFTDARPQSGITKADLVYEVVAEGGITRFLAFFLSDTPEKIGPVRSTREYYLVITKEIADAMLMHIGFSPQALVAIDSWPVRSLSRGGASFWRDETLNVATEHTAYVNGPDLRTLGSELGWDGKPEDFRVWKFKDTTDKYLADPAANKITIDFWYPGDYSAIWQYDAASNSYLRFTGYDSAGNPVAHRDREYGQPQVTVKNLIVQFATEDAILGDEKNRLDYILTGSGDAIIFIDGKAVTATWSKPTRDERTVFYDQNGQEIEFNRGKIWFTIVPDRSPEQVVYE